MATFEKATFTDQTIEVDGNLYEDCKFNNCTLVYRGGDVPQFYDCKFKGGDVKLEGGATRTAEYLSRLNRAGLSLGVENVISRVKGGQIPNRMRPPGPDAVNVGKHYGRLAAYIGVLLFVAFVIMGFFWFAYLTNPNTTLADSEDVRPLSEQIPLDIMPALPDNLAEAYDSIYAEQYDQLASYAWINQDAGVAQIPVDDAIALILERGMPSPVSGEE